MKMNIFPEISIIMPAYNSEKYIRDTIVSLLNQTYQNFELIVVDDGSTDSTFEIVKNFTMYDSRVFIYRTEHKGEVFARNFALTKINPNSKFIMNHDSDDISLPTKLEKLYNYLKYNPEIAIVGCLAEYIDENGCKLNKSPQIEVEPQKIFETFGEVNSMINSAALIRRIVFDNIGNYREEFKSVDDYDFFARALMYGFKLKNIPEVLHYIRLHPHSIGSTRQKEQEFKAKKIKHIYLKFLEKNTFFTKKRLKILLTVEFFYPHLGGSEIVVQKIAEGLLKLGHNVEIATQYLPERDFNELNGIKIHQFQIQGKLPDGIYGKDIKKYLFFLYESNYDLVFNYAAQQWATELNFYLLGATRQRRVNILAAVGFSALDSPYKIRYPNWYDYFQRVLPRILPLYDSVVFHSRNYQDYLFANAIGLNNISVIPNGIDLNEFSKPTYSFREKYKISTKFVLLCVANFYPSKRQDQLIEIFKKTNRTDTTLVLIGKEGLNEYLLKIKQATENIQNIKLLINISREDTIAAFYGADLFVFPSEIEAFPLVLLEAKFAKLPFVSTNCGNAAELEGGIVTQIEEFPKYINLLLDNPNLRKELGEKGHQEILRKYTWENVVEQYNKLFLETYFNKFIKNFNSITQFQVKPQIGDIEYSFIHYLRMNPHNYKVKLDLVKYYIENNNLEKAELMVQSILPIEENNFEAKKLFEVIQSKKQ